MCLECNSMLQNTFKKFMYSLTKLKLSFAVDLFIKGYAVNMNKTDNLNNGIIHRCKDYNGIISILGCYGGFLLVPDYRPASPLVGFPLDKKLIMVKPAQGNFKKLKTSVSSECSKLL